MQLQREQGQGQGDKQQAQQLARNFNKTLRRSRALKCIFARHQTRPQSQRSLHFIFASCFRLSSSFALSLIEIPAGSQPQPQPHLPSHPFTPSLPLSLVLPIFIIAAIIWQMLLSPAPVSSVSLQLSLFLLPLPTSYSIPAPYSSLPALLSLFLALLSLPQLASAVPGQRLLFVSWRCLCSFCIFPTLFCLSCSSSSATAAIYLIAFAIAAVLRQGISLKFAIYVDRKNSLRPIINKNTKNIPQKEEQKKTNKQ